MVEVAHRLPSKSEMKKKFPADDRATYSLPIRHNKTSKWPLIRESQSARVCEKFMTGGISFHLNNTATAAPVAADSPAKKTKKAEAKPAEATKEAAPKSILKKNEKGTKSKTEKAAAPAKTNGEPTRQVKPRKRAADFLTDEEAEEPVAPVKADKKAEKKPAAKKSKKEEAEATPAPKKAAAKKAAPKTKKPEPVVESEEEEAEEDVSPADESEAENEGDDDQTEALIKGFESSGDEDESDGEGYKEGEPIPKAPDTKKAERKLAKQLRKNGPPEEPGTVYIG